MTPPGTTIPLDQILAEFSPVDQAEIRKHAAELVRESRTIAQFRREVGMTQAELARVLDTSQAYIAKIEKPSPSGTQISTITRVAAALGGEWKIVVSLPGRPDTVLALPKPEERPKRPRARTKAMSGSSAKGRRSPA
jgi:transcriptional regulator with XRE-family HTH domain